MRINSIFAQFNCHLPQNKTEAEDKTNFKIKLNNNCLVMLSHSSLVYVCVPFYSWLEMEFSFDCHIWSDRENMNSVYVAHHFYHLDFNTYNFILLQQTICLFFLRDKSSVVAKEMNLIRKFTL